MLRKHSRAFMASRLGVQTITNVFVHSFSAVEIGFFQYCLSALSSLVLIIADMPGPVKAALSKLLPRQGKLLLNSNSSAAQESLQALLAGHDQGLHRRVSRSDSEIRQVFQGPIATKRQLVREQQVPELFLAFFLPLVASIRKTFWHGLSLNTVLFDDLARKGAGGAGDVLAS